MPLTDSDQKFWGPIIEVRKYVHNLIPHNGHVLEVGPGTHHPFPRANVAVDFVELPNSNVKSFICDLAIDKLPFPDKSFDFIYCRHVLEDMYNPFLLCREMSRVGKAGYIETPSILAEMCRGVDGASPPWRGYSHHRFFVWADRGTLKFLSKYSIVDTLQVNDSLENLLQDSLRRGPAYWNTFFLWKDNIRLKHLQCPMDFAMPSQYGEAIVNGLKENIVSIEEFLDIISKRSLYVA